MGGLGAGTGAFAPALPDLPDPGATIHAVDRGAASLRELARVRSGPAGARGPAWGRSSRTSPAISRCRGSTAW
ncbi:MAG TPA: hypothetical protein VFC31_15395 [Candidatus Limnocylindria bacterium]|nr:hypothetical protein [Candidatus Limnocylindria bacterium]